MTFSLEDLPPGVSVEGEGRKQTTSDKVVYFRSFQVRSTPILGSRFLTLRAESQLVAKENDARVSLELLSSKRGRAVLLRTFVHRADIPGRATVAPLAGLPAGMVGSVISLRTPKGPFQAFLITLRVSNVVESLTSFGPAADVDAEDLAALAVKARDRLERSL